MKFDNRYACGKKFEVGDRVALYGYRGTITRISADWKDGDNETYPGKRFQQVEVELDPSEDHIENTIYGKGCYGTFNMGFIK